MNRKIYSFIAFVVCMTFTMLHASVVYGQDYKDMMEDNGVNFYTVVQEADNHFADNGKGKGSGWKQFERWVADNEFKYYPDGDRDQEDPYFVSKAFEAFNETTPKALFPNGWEELGPWESGTITGHYSHGLGRIATHFIDPANPQKMYLGTATGGFWRTTDGGASWSVSTDYLPATGVNTIAARPTNSNDVFVNIGNSQNGYTHGIYGSVDGGVNWALSDFNPSNLSWGGLGDNERIYKIVYHPTIADKVYVGTTKGLYISTDDLATWTQVVSSYDVTDIEFHPTDPDIVYIYDTYYWGPNQNYVFSSTDGGLNFTASNAFVGNDDAQIHITTSPVCANCVYAASSNGVWKSTDSGASFTFISNPSQSCIGGFAVSNLDDDNMIYGYVDAMASTDGGTTFNQVTYWSLGNTNGAGSGHQVSFNTSTDYIHADLQYATCLNGVFYGVTDGFLVKSTDNGISWVRLNEGTGIRMNYNLGVSQSNHERTICGSQDNGTSIKVQGDWIELTGGDGMEGLIHPLNDDWMISSYQYGSHRVTKDGGYSSSSGTAPNSEGYWISPMMYDPNEQMRVYQFSDTIHRSDDFAGSWTMLGTPNFGGDIKFATIAENNSDLIVVSRNEFIKLSTDGGLTFSSIQGSLPSYSITDVVFDPNDDNTLIVTYGRYQNDNSKVFITHNQGASWTNITHNLGNMPVRSVVIDHTSASTIYLGTEIGIYKKPMSGNSWTLYNPDLPNMSVRELDIMWGSNTLRASTWGRGLWEFTLDGRTDHPAIISTEITNPPTFDEPKETVEQFVTSNIVYDFTLTNVYVEWSANTPTFGNVISMSNSSGNEWVSDSPIPDQPAGTKVFFKVYAVGSSGDVSETYKFMYTVREFEYCDASGSSSSGNLYLSQVDVANMSNSSANDAYTYYPNSVVNLSLNGTYSISLNANTGWSSNDMGAWIDFNDDATFDAAEAILADPNTGNSSTASFTVPLDAVVGDTVRLRIRLGYWDSPALDPCGTTLGEMEDYPVIISDPYPVWTGNMNTDWDELGNWSNNLVPTALDSATIPTNPVGGNFPNVNILTAEVNDMVIQTSATITISGGNALTVNGVLTNDGAMHVNNNGSLVQTTGSTLAGSGIYNIARIGSSVYDFWSSPITSASTGLLGGTVYQYNPFNGTADPADDAFDPGWGTPGAIMTSGKGYAAYGAGSVMFTGTSNNSNIPTAVSYHAAPAVSINLIGNPYPSGIDVSSFLNLPANSSLLTSATIYFWDDPGNGVYTSGDFATRTILGGTAGGGGNTPTNVVGSGQGFQVNVNATGTLNFTNAMRTTGNTSMLFRPMETKLLWMSATSSENRYNQTLVGFVDDGTDGPDWAYDGPKLNMLGDLSFHSYIDGEPYAIQAYGPLNNEQIVPLGLNSGFQTSVTIELDSVFNMEDETIVLEDRYFNLFHDLRQTPFVFQASELQYPDRFFLHVGAVLLTDLNEDLESTSLQAFVSSDILDLSLSGYTEAKASLDLLDMRGRSIIQIEDIKFSDGQASIQLSNLQQGMYIVRVGLDRQVLSKKVLNF